MTPHDNDKKLWERIIETIIPLNRDDVLPKGKSRLIQAKQLGVKSKATPKPIVKIEKKVVSNLIQPVDRSLSRKIDKGQVKVDAKLDLHGLTVARAHDVFNVFIEQCVLEKKKRLIVVTGKGNATRGMGKIRRELPFWAQHPSIAHYIHQISEPAQNMGRFYIVLRVKNKKT